MPIRERRVLVTGGAGFIGSHVARAYLERGDRVVVLDNLETGRRENVPSDAEFVELDVRDPDAARLVAEGRFDLVSHHAAQMDVRRSVEDPCFDADVNLLGLLRLLEASRKAGVRRFVYVSSGGVVYGEPEERPTPEVAPKLPLSPYGVSKLAGEHYLFYYHRVHGLDYVALRYANVYGPGQDPHGEAGVVSIFSTRLLQGEPLVVYGTGEQTRDYVFVGDVVAANVVLSDAELPRARCMDDRAFNVGTGRETSVRELAGVLMDAAGIRVETHHAPARAGELLRSCLDASRLRAMGWQPRTRLASGLRLAFDAVAAATPAPGA